MLLYLFCFLTAAVLLAADQWTKFWVESHMVLEEIRPLLPPVLELHAVHNYGAAWSLFAGARWVLVGVTGAMMLAVAAALFLRLVRHPLGVFSGFLILAGGVGNLLDRIFQGYVVDMLRFPFWTAYPTFNVADMCVVTGCVLWLVYVTVIKEDRLSAEEGGVPAGELPRPADIGLGVEEQGENTESAGNAPGEEQPSASETPPVPEAPPIPKATPAFDSALLGGSPWKAMFAEEDDEEDDEDDDEDDEEDGEEEDGGDDDDSEDAYSGGEAPRREGWDSAENFFGGTPFRMSGQNGRVWP